MRKWGIVGLLVAQWALLAWWCGGPVRASAGGEAAGSTVSRSARPGTR
jgi:hypothetical protein